MLPLIDFGVLSLPSYWVMLVLAIGAGTTIAVERARRDGTAVRSVLIASVAASGAGVLGARAWSAFVEHTTLLDRFDIRALWTTSGLGVFGGLAAGAATAWIVSRFRRQALLPVADAMAPGFAVGLSIGRIGCLLAGCCFGRPTLFPIALVFDDFACAARPIGVPLHATQLYESAGAIVLGIALWWTPNKPVAGLRFAALLLGYGLLRAGLETLRFDYRGWVGGVSAPTIASLLATIAGLLLLGRIATAWRQMHAARPQ